ncbi:hypothetical protein FRB99_005493 [Tulasnella sp. 403]|nr:hypothetical protein FRB99_005493 [Tulasnella sp. 403]
MRGRPGHGHSQSHSGAVNQRAQLANAYQELGKELASERIKVVGNYTLGKVIGEGAYGKVRIGTHRLTSTRVAIKQIPKALSASLTREIHHHRRLHHPNVTQLYEVIATESSIWLITELCAGGELYDYLVEKGRLSEMETRQIFGELCLALNYVHGQGVVHRDLKLENVLLDEHCHVKLSDFGFTREFEQGRFLETFCGTTGYAAPEMLLCKKYTGSEIDMWSLGIILYCLLVGTLPFDDDNEELMRQKIVHAEYDDPTWLSDEARNLIRNLLQKDPVKRLTLPQTLAHPWFSRPILEEPDSQPLPPAVPQVIDLTEDGPAAAAQSASRRSQKLEPIAIPDSSSSSRRPSASPSPINHSPRDEQPASSVTSDATFHSATSGFSQSDEGNDLPATPADSASGHDFARTALSVEDETTGGEEPEAPSSSVTETRASSSYSIHRMESQSTIRKQASEKASPVDPGHQQTAIATVPEEVHEEEHPERASPDPVARLKSRASSSSLPPSSFPGRTPVRTKRRSVSSNLTNSPPASPTYSPPPAAALGNTSLPDFHAMSNLKAPLAFSTDLERNLLSSLSLLGFDTAQTVHSVLTDACDAASALWWMLKKKAERKEAMEKRKQEERAKAAAALESKSHGRKRSFSDTTKPIELPKRVLDEQVVSPEPSKPPTQGRGKRSTSISNPEHPPPSTSPRPPVALMLGQPAAAKSSSALGSGPSAPDVTFIPPTPVTLTHELATPPKPDYGRRTPPPPSTSFPFNLTAQFHSPGSGNAPVSPDRKDGKRNSKPRASSVSMLQRATTALSAAGLTRKKSSEVVKDKDDGTATAGSSVGSLLRANGSAEDARPSSAGSHMSNKLTKSPPMPKDKDKEREAGTPPASSISSGETPKVTSVPSEITPGSPWAFPEAGPSRRSGLPASISFHRSPHPAPTPANSPGNTLSGAPPMSKDTPSTGSTGSSGTVKPRNRASLLAAFRMWFNEDKRKRKAAPSLPTIPAGVASHHAYQYVAPASSIIPSPRPGYAVGSIKKGKKSASISSTRAKRPSVSSRRSSSLNSRRSSLNSINQPVGTVLPPSIANNFLSRQRSDASRRSLGTRTPTSDIPSRPSSVHSFTMNPVTPAPKAKRHSKGSSTSSAGSVTPAHHPRKTPSPMHPPYHRRGGSGSSTKVLRQYKNSTGRSSHARSDSQASSIKSRASSRPGSFHEASETEGIFLGVIPRSASPMLVSRRSTEDARGQYGSPVMVAHRKGSLFGPPSAGRSSWKKSWGNEPPTWSSRSVTSPPEPLPDPSRPNIRDVFAARTSIGAGDDSDWVDEDDDEPGFLGGLGQPTAPLTLSTTPTNGKSLLPASTTGNSPTPGSPCFKKAELPSVSGIRNRRNYKGASDNGMGRHHGKSSPTPMMSVQEETREESSFVDGPSAWSRRQLPPGRGGPAFKQAIQEEEEDEEE